MRLRQRLAAALLAFSILGGTGLAAAAPSSAATYVASGVSIRSAPHVNATRYGLGYPGQSVTEYWYTSGDYVYGCTSYYGCVYSNIWSYDRNNSTGVQGFSWTWYISN
jgi:hypothetical protein